ncbi:MAG: hypothetical protein ACPG66_09895, partial [Flavobacteriales bacterium]
SLPILALCLSTLSCTLPSSEPSHSLVVLDVDGSPPADGFVLLVKSTGFGANSVPLGLEVLDDTLHWAAEDGTVLPTHCVPSQAQWVVFSPDPMPPHSWRHVRLDATGQDTCRLSSALPIQLNLRLSRTVGVPVESYFLAFSDAMSIQADTFLLEGTQGGVRFAGEIPFRQLPVQVSLERRRTSAATHVVASHTQETVPWELPIRLNWSDLDDTTTP